MSNRDYLDLSAVITFEDCETIKCQQLVLIDDESVEETETLSIVLSSSPDLDPIIRLNVTETRVFITDDDCEWKVRI